VDDEGQSTDEGDDEDFDSSSDYYFVSMAFILIQQILSTTRNPLQTTRVLKCTHP